MSLARSVFTLLATPRWTGQVVGLDLLCCALGELVVFADSLVLPVPAQLVSRDNHRRGAAASSRGKRHAAGAQQRPAASFSDG